MIQITLYLLLILPVLSIKPYIDNHEGDNDELYFFDNQMPHQRFRRSNEITNAGKKIENIGHESGKFIEVGNENDSSFVNITAGYDKNFWNEKNLSEPIMDDHIYYNSTYFPQGGGLFIDISDNDNNKVNHLTIKKHDKLSKSFKKAFKVPLQFSFPFYGSLVDYIVVTTGGFINISPYFHSYIHLVHYVAPLMANFNPNKSVDSKVFVAFGDGVAIIQWNKMLLNGTNNFKEAFTFQIQLYRNGTIILAYKDVPLRLNHIKKTGPLNVTVGLSDGFIMRYRHLDLKKRRLVYHNYVYSYHKVNLSLDKVASNAAFQLDMMESCVQFKSCSSCMQKKKYFKCKWCPQINLCSDTLDWYRQRWLIHNCHRTAIAFPEKCDIKNANTPSTNQFKKKKVQSNNDNGNAGKVIGGIIGGILLTIIIIVVAFFVYAYYHPQSKSGMWLIEHRPSRIFATSFDKVPEEELL